MNTNATNQVDQAQSEEEMWERLWIFNAPIIHWNKLNDCYSDVTGEDLPYDIESTELYAAVIIYADKYKGISRKKRIELKRLAVELIQVINNYHEFQLKLKNTAN